MTDLLVILGAGASHDALPEGDEPPPVAKMLFDRTYADIQIRFPGVAGLRDHILARLERHQNLETILGELGANPDENIQRQLFEFPIYLKALLAQFSGVRIGSTYDQLLTMIQQRGLTVTFVTLNYDTLLDESIERMYNTNIGSMDDYVGDKDGDRAWTYVKLHGSVNWEYPTVVDTDISTTLTVVHRVDQYLAAIDHNHDHIANTTDRIHLADGNYSLTFESILTYPALAVPTDTKQAVVCPGGHVRVLQSALKSDPSILVIGNQGLDTDLMSILSESAPRYSNKPFRVVDKKDTSVVTHRFAEALIRGGYSMYPDVSFREFVGSEDADRFFDEVREAKTAAATDRLRL